MGAKKYPFRYYGREPADWIQSPQGFFYDVQFADPLGAEAQEAVRMIAERHFSRGPAELGEIWAWGADRFLVFSVKERFHDSPRMVFTQVAELLTHLHLDIPLKDVVFCNGHGSRANRWDAWSLKRSPTPDPGPSRPQTQWAQMLTRPEAEELTWSGATKQASEPADTSKTAETKKPPRPKKPKIDLEPCEAPPPDDPEAQRIMMSGWTRLEEAYQNNNLRTTQDERAHSAQTERLENLSVPMLVENVNNERRALLCFDGRGEPCRIELPKHKEKPSTIAVDPDGLHAVTHAGQTLYSIDLAQGSLRRRVSIHHNNGAIESVAWVVDDLWAVRSRTQCMLFDLSEEDAIYVATLEPRGSLIGSFRHGTLLAFRDPNMLTLIGICDWQMKILGRVRHKKADIRIIDDELYGVKDTEWTQLVRTDEVYEAWAAPLRKRAERLRAKRFQKKSRSKKPRWQWCSEDLPPDTEKQRRDELSEKYGDACVVSVTPDGSAAVAIPMPNKEVEGGAKLRWCPIRGKSVLLKSATAAKKNGIVTYSVSPDKEFIYHVTGTYFAMGRTRIDKDKSETCNLPNFIHYGKLLFDIIAVDSKDVLVLWSDCIDWYRQGGKKWRLLTKEKTVWPRGFQHHPATNLLAVTQQSLNRLRLYRVGKKTLDLVARFADDIKVVSFRQDRLYAQMTDGHWFELINLPEEEIPPRNLNL